MFNDKVSVSQLVELRNELINLKNESVNDIKLKNSDIIMIVESLIEEKKKVEEMYQVSLQMGRTLSHVVTRLDSMRARGIS
jgi:hypothetical protein